MTSTKIYHCHSSDGYLYAAFNENDAVPLRQLESVEFLDAAPFASWASWHLEWFRHSNREETPDFTHVYGKEACSRNAAHHLFTNGGNGDFELLPLTIHDESWFLLRPLRWTDTYDPVRSRIEWNIWKEPDGVDHRSIYDIPWINVIDARAFEWDAFMLSIAPKGKLYFTQRFINRYESLALKGIHFEHVGYAVDSVEHAMPEPSRATPKLQQAPRWPKWEVAREDEVARFTQSGQAFLQALGLNESAEAASILSALAAEIETHRLDYGTLKPKPRKEILDGLAGAFGLLVRRELRWNWVDLQVTSRSWDLGLESPNGSHALCLNQVMVRQLTSHEPSTITLLFNMMAAGNLPDAQPGDRVAIG